MIEVIHAEGKDEEEALISLNAQVRDRRVINILLTGGGLMRVKLTAFVQTMEQDI